MKHFLLFSIFAVFSLLSTEGFAQNIFPVGDMESGVDDWTARFRNGAEGTVGVTDDAVNGSQAMLIDVTTAAPDGDITKGQAESNTFTEGYDGKACYKFSAIMKSNVVENEMKMKMLPLDASGGKQHISSPKNPDGSFYHLTTEYKKYQWLVSNIKPGYDQGFYLQLQVGSNVAQYFVDDLMIEKIQGIENGDFENEEELFAISTNVATESGAAANFSIDTENANSGSNALKVEVTTSNDTVGAVNIVTDTRFYPEMGKKYEFSIYAKGTGENDSISVDVNFYDQDNGFLDLKSNRVKVTNDYEKYSVVFEAESADVYSVKFRVGFGKQASTIYVDDMTYGDYIYEMPATVVDVIVNSDDHETLEAAVIAADLAGTLSGEGPFTVFAPTDAAFAALPDGTLDALLADPTGDLTDILLYHVVGDSVVSTMLSDGMKVETLFGDSISVTISEGNVYINDAMVTVADIVAGNGVVHVIDAVLMPDLNTSVNDLHESTLRVYPNPATKIINVEGVKSGAEIEVFSITGVVVKRIEVVSNPTTIDLNDMVQGTYILRSGEKITKFIKK